MKKITATILFTGISFVLSGQEKPRWMDENQRDLNYPAHIYFTGFAYGDAPMEKPLQDVAQQIKTEAQADLSNKIRVQISSQSQNTIAAVSTNGQYDESERFYSQSMTESNAEVVGITIETYHDTKTRTVYAFAAVKRADLAAFYKKQIHVDLNKVETAIDAAEQLVEAGKKISAHRKMEEAKQTLTGISFYRDLLVAVDVEAEESDLQTERGNGLQRTVEQQLIDLEQSTFIYVECRYEYKSDKDDAFSSDPGILCDIITQALSENECSVTDNREEADYELALITSTTQRSDGKGQYSIISYYANVKGTLFNRFTKKKTVDFTIFNDPGAYATGRSPEDAATKAFKLPELKNKVLEKILPKIKN